MYLITLFIFFIKPQLFSYYQFVELIKLEQKTIEIRKLNSIDKLWKKRVSFSHITYEDRNISDNIFYDDTNGLIIEPMMVDDLPSCNCSSELASCQCSNRWFKLAIKGYQRIRVSELKWQISLVNEIKDYKDTEFQLRFKYSPEFWHNKLSWIVNNNLNWLFDEYLKDEEYCIIYFIDKEETLKANGWEVK